MQYFVTQADVKLTDCSVCLKNRRDMLFIPCGHVTCCSSCALTVEICSICQGEIVSKAKVGGGEEGGGKEGMRGGGRREEVGGEGGGGKEGRRGRGGGRGEKGGGRKGEGGRKEWEGGGREG